MKFRFYRGRMKRLLKDRLSSGRTPETGAQQKILFGRRDPEESRYDEAAHRIRREFNLYEKY